MYNYFVLHFFICQLIATCLACLCPFISFLIINLTFSKFMLMPTGIFLPSTCSDSTAKLCCVEEKMIHLAVNVEDSILSMHGHCKKGSPDRHEWTGRQSETDIHTDRETVIQTETGSGWGEEQGSPEAPTTSIITVYSALVHWPPAKISIHFFLVGSTRKVIIAV